MREWMDIVVESGDAVMNRRDERDRERIVTKDDWETIPMPEKNTQFKIKRKFSEEEINRLKRGHCPTEMEDKWFYYYEDGKIYFYRSWSGICVYIVDLKKRFGKYLVTVNRDENQYSNTDIDEDIELVNELLGGY